MNKYKNIYVLCPENKVTGGTEAMHQMVYYLRLINCNAYLIYYDINYNYKNSKTPDRYLQYIKEDSWVINNSNIIDSSENCLITSEFATALLWKYKNISKIVWWLSVKFYDGGVFHLKNSIKHWIKLTIMDRHIYKFKEYHNPYPLKNVINLCASQYAYDYVTKKLKYPAAKCIEPISLDFLKKGSYRNPQDRKSIVVYNPAKPSKLMETLLKRNKLNYIPLQNMNPDQIANLFRKVKLYIDFGEFPGPERIPKEAVYNGANILVVSRNASKNDFDINIPLKYKINENKTKDIKYIENEIIENINNYETNFSDFETFKLQIENLEVNFISSLRSVFLKG